MKKVILVFLALGLSLYGMSYQAFKKQTKQHAKILQSQTLSLQSTSEANKILLRSQNPTLTLEASQFKPDGTSSSFHYAGTVSQNIRTFNYYGGLEDKTQASTLLQQAYVSDGQAGYFRTLEILYTEYVYQSKLLTLLQDEYRLSNKVSNIVKERYTNGSENKVSYLQAKTNTLGLKTQMYTTKQAMNSLYFQLLALGGLSKKVSLEKHFIYSVSAQVKLSTKSTPKEQILAAKTRLLESQIRMNDSVINSYNLYTSFEDEPDQSIVSVGVSLPLPLFNDKSEEKRLAQLQSQQLTLDKEQLSLDIDTQKQSIQASIRELSHQYTALKTLKKEQQILNDLLQEGYKIAQGSIFVMMTAQNKLIQTQKSLLQTAKNINNQKIQLYFIQGDYND